MALALFSLEVPFWRRSLGSDQSDEAALTSIKRQEQRDYQTTTLAEAWAGTQPRYQRTESSALASAGASGMASA